MILVTRPDHDLLTYYLKIWSNELVEDMRRRGFSLSDLKGKRANRRVIESFLNSKKRMNFVFFNGHGNEAEITGFENEVIMSEKDIRYAKNIGIVYARSCRVGVRLGRSLVESGLKSFIGYDFDFAVFLTKGAKPLHDKAAGLFIKPSNLVVLSLLKGNTVFEADKKSKNLMKENIRKLLSSNSNKNEIMARHLYSNLIHQVVIGSGEAAIS